MDGRIGKGRSPIATAAVCLLLTQALAACADNSPSLPSLPKLSELNPFAEKQQPLPGKRIPVMQTQEKLVGELAAGDRPITLPPPRSNDSWSQPGGEPNNSPGHLALSSAIKTAWSAEVGAGSSSRGKLTASPIVYDGKVFTLDAQGRVSAFAMAGGSAVWRVSTTPENEKDEKGFGGGLAGDNGRIYVATGFGVVVALDPNTGKKLWEKNVGVPIRTSPTAAGDRVFAVTMDGQCYALNGADGQEIWTFRGEPEKASIVSNASPAVENDLVVVPYASGDLVALKVSDGQPVWSESLARARTASSLAAMSDTARPAIDGGTVFAVGHAGRMVATSQKTGERLWSLNVPGIQTPWVAGESVFVVDTGGQLMAITRRDGKVQWTSQLPNATTWSGPVLAGGRLWLTSNKGQLVSVDAATGKIASTLDLGQPVYIAPVVAGAHMYVLTDKAKLIALN
jgi:outer membrane protein assembly factor BamB